MIMAAIVGMGWWGRTLVEAVQSESDQIRFVAGATRTVSPEVQAFSDAQTLKLVDSYEALLADRSVDAVVLATPHSLHAAVRIRSPVARARSENPESTGPHRAKRRTPRSTRAPDSTRIRCEPARAAIRPCRRRYSPVVGSITVFTRITFSIGNGPRFACSWIISSFGER